MAIVKPFQGLRPMPELASKVATLPYDVMSTAEARKMAAGNPISFLHVSRAEIDLTENTDVHTPAVYQKASENFQKFIAGRVLFQDRKPCYYAYAQTMNGRRQLGLVACSSIEDYFHDVIKKHEFTRPEKEQDRIEHMQALQAHVGPVFLTHRPHTALREILKAISKENALYNFVAEDDVTHEVWLIENDEIIEQIEQIFQQEIPYTYIADGHHRTASAAKVGANLKAQNEAHTGFEQYNFFLSVLFAADELAIMDYNRTVKDLDGNSVEIFLKKVGEKFAIKKVAASENRPERLHDFGMYVAGNWYRLTAKENSFTDDPIGILDVSILQNNLLAPVLHVEDPRTDTRIDFIGGIRGLSELQTRVDTGVAAVAFALYPVSLPQLIAIADSGQVMPPKSTWFEPKLRDAMFCHQL